MPRHKPLGDWIAHAAAVSHAPVAFHRHLLAYVGLTHSCDRNSIARRRVIGPPLKRPHQPYLTTQPTTVCAVPAGLVSQTWDRMQSDETARAPFARAPFIVHRRHTSTHQGTAVPCTRHISLEFQQGRACQRTHCQPQYPVAVGKAKDVRLQHCTNLRHSQRSRVWPWRRRKRLKRHTTRRVGLDAPRLP